MTGVLIVCGMLLSHLQTETYFYIRFQSKINWTSICGRRAEELYIKRKIPFVSLIYYSRTEVFNVIHKYEYLVHVIENKHKLQHYITTFTIGLLKIKLLGEKGGGVGKVLRK